MLVECSLYEPLRLGYDDLFQAPVVQGKRVGPGSPFSTSSLRQGRPSMWRSASRGTPRSWRRWREQGWREQGWRFLINFICCRRWQRMMLQLCLYLFYPRA